MTEKLEEIKKSIELRKKSIENEKQSAIEALRSGEWSFAAHKVEQIITLEESLEELNLSYENELNNENNW